MINPICPDCKHSLSQHMKYGCVGVVLGSNNTTCGCELGIDEFDLRSCKNCGEDPCACDCDGGAE